MKAKTQCEGCVCTQEDRDRYGSNWCCDHAKADSKQWKEFKSDLPDIMDRLGQSILNMTDPKTKED